MGAVGLQPDRLGGSLIRLALWQLSSMCCLVAAATQALQNATLLVYSSVLWVQVAMH